MKQKEKTIKDWLNTLDEPYKSKALRQTNEELLNTKAKDLISSDVPSLEESSSTMISIFS